MEHATKRCWSGPPSDGGAPSCSSRLAQAQAQAHAPAHSHAAARKKWREREREMQNRNAHGTCRCGVEPNNSNKALGHDTGTLIPKLESWWAFGAS